MAERKDEAQLEDPLLTSLQRWGRLRHDTIIVYELSWFGRHVDIATLNRSGRATAYELKVANSRRAIQQASNNRLAFDRSYVVTVTRPSPQNCRHAEEAGVGVILLREGNAQVIIESVGQPVVKSLRRRLADTIRTRMNNHVQ